MPGRSAKLMGEALERREVSVKSLAQQGMTVAECHLFAEKVRVTKRIYGGKHAREIKPVVRSSVAARMDDRPAQPAMVQVRELICAACVHTVALGAGKPIPKLERLVCSKCGARGKAFYRERWVAAA